MSYTIVYTEAPCCCYCGRALTNWLAFAGVHYHPECHTAFCVEQIRQKLQQLVDSWEVPSNPQQTRGPDE